MACSKIQNGSINCKTIFGRGFSQDQKWWAFMKGILGSLKFQLLEISIFRGVLGLIRPHFKFKRNLNMMHKFIQP